MASFRATLEEAADADLIVHVVDVSHPAWEQQAEVVGEVLHGLVADGAGGGSGAGSGPRVVMALNKVDRLSPNERAGAAAGRRGAGLGGVGHERGDGRQAWRRSRPG